MAISSYARVGSANSYDLAVRNISGRQTALSNLQANLTSGKKIVQTADDPTGAAQAERALTRISRIATDQRALESQRNAVAMAESTLGDVTDALQSFRELVVSAGNGAFSAAERKSVAIQLTGLRDQIISLANRKDTNGLPLFSALGSALTPFVGPNNSGPDYTFDGLPGQTASSEVGIPFTLDGNRAFMLNEVYTTTSNTPTTGGLQQSIQTTVTDPASVTGEAYTVKFTSFAGTSPSTGVVAPPGMVYALYDITGVAPSTFSSPNLESGPFSMIAPRDVPINGIPGISMTITGDIVAGDTISVYSPQSVFSVMDTAILDISSASNSATASSAVAKALGNIDISMERVSAVRGQAGDLLNRADRISDTQTKRSIQLEADRSRAEDLDMIKGISDFNNQQTGFSAALQTYAQVQKLSLFNFIG